MPAFAGMTEFRTFYEFVNVGRSMFDVHQFLSRLDWPFFRPAAPLIWNYIWRMRPPAHRGLRLRLGERFHPSKFDIRYSIFYGSLFNPGHPSDPSIYQKTVPFWGSFIQAPLLAWKAASLIRKKLHFCNKWWSFIQAPPLAASAQSDRKRNFKVLNLLFLDCGSGF